MSTAYFFDPESGVIVGSFTGPLDSLRDNWVEGMLALVTDSRVDAALWKVDPATQQLVPREPALPEPAALARAARERRAALLAGCDWTQAADSPLDPARRAAWVQYRQALRNVTSQPGFPADVQWPTAPT